MEFAFSQGLSKGLGGLGQALANAPAIRQQYGAQELDQLVGAELKAGQAKKVGAESLLAQELLKRTQRRDADLEEAAAASAGLTLPEYRGLRDYQRTGQAPTMSVPDVGAMTGSLDEQDPPRRDEPRYAWQSNPLLMNAGRRALAATSLGGQMKDIDPRNITQAQGELQQQGTSDLALGALAGGNVDGASALNQIAKPGQQIKLRDNIGSTGATFSPATGSVTATGPLAESTIAENNAKAKKAAEGKAGELAGILQAAGIDPASPQGQSLYRALAVKMSTHQPANQTNVVMNQEKEESKAVGKAMGEAFTSIQQAGSDANTKIARYERLKGLLDGVNTGKLTPAGTELAAWADAVGIKVDPKLGNKQAAQALGNEIALSLRNPAGGAGMPGALSDKDREFLVQMVPSLSLTTEGNARLIETAQKIARRDQEVAKLARDYRARKGTLDPGFYDELQQFSDSNPLFGGPQRTVTDYGGTPPVGQPERRASPRPGGGRVLVEY